MHTTLLHIEGFIDALLLAALIFNLWNLLRLSRQSKNLVSLRDEMLRSFVESVGNITMRVCPFCAVAGGHSKATVTDEEGKADLGDLDAEEEVEGWHEVRTPNNPVQRLPCAATALRELARKAFSDLMDNEVKKKKKFRLFHSGPKMLL